MRATDCNGGETWWVNGETREKESSGAGPAAVDASLVYSLTSTLILSRGPFLAWPGNVSRGLTTT